jgi:hypothetical protein
VPRGAWCGGGGGGDGSVATLTLDRDSCGRWSDAGASALLATLVQVSGESREGEGGGRWSASGGEC